jgi:predicted RNA-binding Zn-ribbon protein involved in translation (DUF1610 family)
MWRRRRISKHKFRQMAMYADGADYSDLQNEYVLAQTKLAEGNYIDAARSFEKISGTAMASGIKQGPRLLIETGRAYLYGGETARGMDFLKKGLSYLAQSGRRMSTRQLGENLIYDLQQRGLNQPAQDIHAFLTNLIGDQPDIPEIARWNPFVRFLSGIPAWNEMTHIQTSISSKQGHPVMPTRCPSCGAPISANDVDWADAVTAECPFCGSLIRGDEH